jgi:DNA-directed RNA polymerase omega subunit
MERLLEKTGSMYKLVILAARRALELNDGAPRLIETDSRKKSALIALEEIAAEKVTFRLKKRGKG